MKAKVTKRGVQVPRRMLGDAKEVEIRQENGHVVVIPLPQEDPIFGLGKHPVTCHAPDASEAHDRYLYDESA
ncbi:hypothetical protein [Rhodocaloribacter sp.]